MERTLEMVISYCKYNFKALVPHWERVAQLGRWIESLIKDDAILYELRSKACKNLNNFFNPMIIQEVQWYRASEQKGKNVYAFLNDNIYKIKPKNYVRPNYVEHVN
jgi:hypothetical protein